MINENTIGIMAATDCDCKMGIRFFKNNGFNSLVSYVISDSPEEQTRLQKDQDNLMSVVVQGIKKLTAEGAQCIVIYCNSLSGALNLAALRESCPVHIITPIETYIESANRFRKFGVLGANCQSVYNIEKIIMQNNPKATIIGFGSLELVKAVEKNQSAIDIINNFQLKELFRIFTAHECEAAIIGCTHFNYFLDILTDVLSTEKYSLTIIEPSQQMLQIVMDALKMNV